MKQAPGFRLALWGLAAAPVLFAFWYVAGFTLRVPLFDHWGLLPVFAGFAAGHPSVLGFLAPHNGLHVTVVPRLLLAALATVTGWSFRAEIFLGFSLGVYTVWVASLALRESLPEGDFRTTRAVCTALTAAVSFSPAAYWIWTWSIGFYHYFENAAVMTAVFAVAARRPRFRLLALSCALATLNRFEGLFTWMLFFPAALAAARRTDAPRRNLGIFLGTGAVCVAGVGAILLLTRPPELGVASTPHAGDYAVTILATATSLLGMAPGGVAEYGGTDFFRSAPFFGPGLVVAALFAVLAGLALGRIGRKASVLAWVALGAFGAAFAFATAVARVALAAPALTVLTRLYQSSYSETAALVAVATIHLGGLLHANRAVSVRRLFPGLAALSALVLAAGTARALPHLLARRAAGHWDRYCLELSEYLAPANACFIQQDGARQMEDAHFALVRHNVVFAPARDQHERILKSEERFDPVWGMRTMTIRGFVTLPDDSAGTVALAFEGEHSFFSLATSLTAETGGSRFVAEVPAIAVRPHRTRVNAWTYDRAGGVFRPIAGTVNTEELLEPAR